MAFIPPHLKDIDQQLKDGKTPQPVSVRTLLSWFGAQRRGNFIVYMIREALQALKLRTVPRFEYAYIDAEIEFRRDVAATPKHGAEPVPIDAAPSLAEVGSEGVAAMPGFVGGTVQDPTHRIGKLASANTPPVSVIPDDELSVAVTLMLSHDFSQLPVMQNDRQVKGMISWGSIGARLSLGRNCTKVRECMETAVEVSSELSLFSAIHTIVQNQYVLVRDTEGKISGIVTTSDLSLQFEQLGEPFLLLGEIEEHIRRLIFKKFTLAELKQARHPSDSDRDVKNVSDLSFGEYIRLLENPENWKKLNLKLDRSVFLSQLREIGRIRNDVMHFDPDGISDLERQALRKFVQFLRELEKIGVSGVSTAKEKAAAS